jgi:hypothetical protein
LVSPQVLPHQLNACAEQVERRTKRAVRGFHDGILVTTAWRSPHHPKDRVAI